MITVMYIFLSLVVLKTIINVSRLIEINIKLNQYLEYVKNPTFNFIEKKQRIISLFQFAGIQDSSVPYVEPAGYGQITRGMVSVFDNLGVTREDFYGKVMNSFYEARGVYKQRIVDSINPIYWILSILNFPKLLLEFFGVKPDSFITKIFQFIWWLLGIFFMVIGIFFRAFLDQLISRWFQ